MTWEDYGGEIMELVRSIKYDLKRKQMLLPDRMYMQCESRRVEDESGEVTVFPQAFTDVTLLNNNSS